MYLVFAYNDYDQFRIEFQCVDDLMKGKFYTYEDASEFVRRENLNVKYDNVEVIEV